MAHLELPELLADPRAAATRRDTERIARLLDTVVSRVDGLGVKQTVGEGVEVPTLIVLEHRALGEDREEALAALHSIRAELEAYRARPVWNRAQVRAEKEQIERYRRFTEARIKQLEHELASRRIRLVRRIQRRHEPNFYAGEVESTTRTLFRATGAETLQAGPALPQLFEVGQAPPDLPERDRKRPALHQPTLPPRRRGPDVDDVPGEAVAAPAQLNALRSRPPRPPGALAARDPFLRIHARGTGFESNNPFTGDAPNTADLFKRGLL